MKLAVHACLCLGALAHRPLAQQLLTLVEFDGRRHVALHECLEL